MRYSVAALLSGAHTARAHWDLCRRNLPPASSTVSLHPYSHPSVTRQASRLGQVSVPLWDELFQAVRAWTAKAILEERQDAALGASRKRQRPGLPQDLGHWGHWGGASEVLLYVEPRNSCGPMWSGKRPAR